MTKVTDPAGGAGMRRHEGPTTLYRFFDAAGELLYIGVTNRPARRIKEHSGQQPWWLETARATLEHFPTRKAAEAAEAFAIRTEHPRYNIVHNGRGAVRATWRQEQALLDVIARVGHLSLAGRSVYSGRLVFTFDWDPASWRHGEAPPRVRIVIAGRPIRELAWKVRDGDDLRSYRDAKIAASVRRMFPDDWVLLAHEVDARGVPLIEVNAHAICTDVYPAGHSFTDLREDVA